MDRTDYQILNLLQGDSRTTLKAIGDRVGLTAPAVSERIRRMEDKGVIQSFSIHVDRTLLDCNLTGFILVAIFPDKYNQFCQFCQEHPAITAHHHLVGKLNALLRFAVKDTHQLDQLRAAIKQYGDSQTSVELGTYFVRKAIPIPEN